MGLAGSAIPDRVVVVNFDSVDRNYFPVSSSCFDLILRLFWADHCADICGHAQYAILDFVFDFIYSNWRIDWYFVDNWRG